MKYQITKQDKIPSNPLSLIYLANKYLLALTENNYSKQTISKSRYNLKYFINWCYEQNIFSVVEISKATIDQYTYYLQNTSGIRIKKKFSSVTIKGKLSILSRYFKWITKKNYLIHNPASTIIFPKKIKTLPKNILSIEEVEQIINTPDITKDTGIRDRAMLELFYSSGIRREELVNLTTLDIDFERGILFILEGKYKQDRYVPVTERALKWLEKYIYQVRPNLLINRSEKRLFITKDGEPFSRLETISMMVRKYIKKAKVNKPGACHLFRHTVSTLMLENGADIRYIMSMLGHRYISSTQIYTKVSMKKLTQVHLLTHPANIEARTLKVGEYNDN